MNSQTITEVQKFTSDIVWVAASDIIPMLSSIVTLPALTKNYPVDLYGVWVQVGVTIGLLSPVLLLHLSTAVVRFLAAEEDKNKIRYTLGAMLLPILVFVCFGFFTSLILRHNLSIFLFADAEYAFFVPLAFLWASIEALFSFSLSYLRARGKIKKLSIIRSVFAIAKMLVIVILAVANFRLEWVIGCITAVEAIFVVIVFTIIEREVGLPRLNTGGLKGFLVYSIPLIPHGVLLWVINASDRYFITHFLDLSQTGIYSASYALGSLISLFYSPISFVLFPTITKFWEQKEIVRVRSYLEYSTKLFLTLAIPGIAGLYTLSQPLLGILATTEYMAGEGLVLLIALGVLLFGIYQINVYVIYLLQQTKWLTMMTAVAALTNAGINILLIPQIGTIGAAISTIVSYFILTTIVTLWARKTISYKVGFKYLVKILLSTAVMGVCMRIVPVSGVLSLVLAVTVGTGVYILGIVLLKAFSQEDKRLVREMLSGLVPWLWKRKPVGNLPLIQGLDPVEQCEKNKKLKEG